MYINQVNTRIMPIRFEYHVPTSLDAAVELLSKYGKEANLLAGGTDLLINMKQRLVEPKYIINIKNIKELIGIEEREDGINIGAATRLRTIEMSDMIQAKLPLLHEAVRSIGSVQIRNMATIGGNLCNASPTADSATALLALDAKARIIGPEGTRIVPMEKFFVGAGQTVLRPNEILVEVLSPHLTEDTGTSFIKIGWTSFDISTINIAAVLKLEGGHVNDCRIALGACAPTPIRVNRVEEFLKGQKLTSETLEAAANIISEYIKPRERWRRAPAEYRRAASKALIRDALTIASKRIERRQE